MAQSTKIIVGVIIVIIIGGIAFMLVRSNLAATNGNNAANLAASPQDNAAVAPSDQIDVQGSPDLSAKGMEAARKRAQIAGFKAAASAVVPAAVMCCDQNGSLNTSFGKDICTPVVNSRYQDATSFGMILKTGGTNSDCNGGKFQLTITPGADYVDSGCTDAVCSATGCIFDGC